MEKNQSSIQQQINIELPPDQAEGTYANLAIISHSSAEFFIDFTRVLPGVPKAKVYSRIIMAPQHIKSLLMALQDNIKKYESQYEEIKIHSSTIQQKSIGFQSTHSEHK